MRPIEILMAEHRRIERVLDALETAAGQVARQRPVRPGFFLDAADFIAGYADGCHHHKEEDVLFGALGGPSGPEAGGMVEMMLEEHREGRRLTGGMREAAHRLESGDQSARGPLVANARQYVALLRDHIEKEDEMLFPMTGDLLSAEQQEELVRRIDRIEEEEAAAGTHAKYHALADALAREAAAFGA